MPIKEKNYLYWWIITLGEEEKTEGELLKNKSLEFGIDENDILITKKVQNTYEEANAIYHLIDKNLKYLSNFCIPHEASRISF